jgi:hypothetical protein
MIKYSTSRSRIRVTNPPAPTWLVRPIEKEYRELLGLRQRVKKAEAAAANRLKPLGKLKKLCRPAARVTSRKTVVQQPKEFTKHQLYALLAEAVRNTH